MTLEFDCFYQRQPYVRQNDEGDPKGLCVKTMFVRARAISAVVTHTTKHVFGQAMFLGMQFTLRRNVGTSNSDFCVPPDSNPEHDCKKAVSPSARAPTTQRIMPRKSAP